MLDGGNTRARNFSDKLLASLAVRGFVRLAGFTTGSDQLSTIQLNCRSWRVDGSRSAIRCGGISSTLRIMKLRDGWSEPIFFRRPDGSCTDKLLVVVRIFGWSTKSQVRPTKRKWAPPKKKHTFGPILRASCGLKSQRGSMAPTTSVSAAVKYADQLEMTHSNEALMHSRNHQGVVGWFLPKPMSTSGVTGD